MRSAHSGVKLTYDDYMLFPEDGQRHELIDGEHYVSPPPFRKHQGVVTNLIGMIWSHLRTHRLGQVYTAPFAVVFSHYDVVEPDVLYLSNERIAEIEVDPYVKGAPNLVVEVASRSTRKRDRTIKRRLYQRFGVDEYWIIDPDATIVCVFRRQGQWLRLAAELALERGDVLTTPLLPDLDLPLTTIFE